MILKNMNIVLENEVLKGDLLIRNGKIINISAASGSDCNCGCNEEESYDFTGKFLVPGFIDLHTHGISGFDAMDGTEESVAGLARNVLKRGVTSFLATLLTESNERISKGFKAVRNVMNAQSEDSADIMGIYMEGPFFADKYKGAQNPKFLQYGSSETLDLLIGENWDILKILALAPERIDLNILKKLNKHGIITALGHTEADSNLVEKASLLGVSHAVHLYNGMLGLHHREPGTAGGVLSNERISAELILDGIHVHPKMAKIAYMCKKEKLILITDAMRATGLPDGKYDLGGQDVFVKGDEARLENGSLAGSTLTMNVAFKNALKYLDSNIVNVAKLTSTNAANKLGLKDRGLIEPGRNADFVILNQDYDLEKVIKDGKIF